VIPIAKKSHPVKLEDFRPISILPAMSKILEIILKNQMTSYFLTENLLTDCQSGFRSGHSTTTALVKIVDDLTLKLESGEMAALILLDFSKAFDRINHDLLITKLKNRFGFSKSALALIKSFLSNRKQRVISNEDSSNDLPISLGVPQGSILSPLLFAAFINDLSHVLNPVSYHLFADDVQLYDSAPRVDFKLCTDRLNSALERVSCWTKENGLLLNPNKCQAIPLSAAYRPLTDLNNLPSISVNGTTIRYSDSVKNLGVWFDTRLTWNAHVNRISASVYSTLGRLWVSTRFMSVELRKKLVISLIMPRFIYGSQLFVGAPKSVWSKLNMAFNSCIRYVYRRRRYDSIRSVPNEILGCSLEKYLLSVSCSFIHKLIISNTPRYLSKRINFAGSNRTRNLELPLAHLRCRRASLFVHGICIYNKLDIQTRCSITVGVFRRACLSNLISLG
jgi:hypothetical protein